MNPVAFPDRGNTHARCDFKVSMALPHSKVLRANSAAVTDEVERVMHLPVED